jgi:hypothetical protein
MHPCSTHLLPASGSVCRPVLKPIAALAGDEVCLDVQVYSKGVVLDAVAPQARTLIAAPRRVAYAEGA